MNRGTPPNVVTSRRHTNPKLYIIIHGLPFVHLKLPPTRIKFFNCNGVHSRHSIGCWPGGAISYTLIFGDCTKWIKVHKLSENEVISQSCVLIWVDRIERLYFVIRVSRHACAAW
jgi:hypothetical protein